MWDFPRKRSDGGVKLRVSVWLIYVTRVVRLSLYPSQFADKEGADAALVAGQSMDDLKVTIAVDRESVGALQVPFARSFSTRVHPLFADGCASSLQQRVACPRRCAQWCVLLPIQASVFALASISLIQRALDACWVISCILPVAQAQRQTLSEKKTDRRHLYLLFEGAVSSAEAASVPARDIAKRESSLKSRKARAA